MCLAAGWARLVGHRQLEARAGEDCRPAHVAPGRAASPRVYSTCPYDWISSTSLGVSSRGASPRADFSL